MSRLIDDATKRNTWGAAAAVSVNRLEPQRADLWYVDFTNALTGVGEAFGQRNIVSLRKQMVQSISLPENKIKVEPYRRDSIPYQMPSWDEPLDAVKMTFVMETNSSSVSDTYSFLTNWLEIVRAGRGFRSSGYNSNNRGEEAPLLDENFQSVYRFDCFVSFLRGSNSKQTYSDLEAWQTLRLQQMYVASVKISDLSYTSNALTTIEASFYVESVDWLSTP